MTITITAPGEYLCDSKDEPKTGCRYSLEDATHGTLAQNNLFHALIDVYYKSGMWSYQGSGYNQGATYTEFRNMIKRKLGAGFEAFVYVELVDGRPVIKDAKVYADIPEAIRKDPHMKEMIRGRLKSWSDYRKSERRSTIDNLIAEMMQVGVNTPHFHEIMQGISEAFS